MNDLTPQYVLAALHRGRDAATPIGELSEALRLPRRAVEASVQALRLEGWEVCSDGSGIWLGDVQDLDATLLSLRGRLVSQYQTYLALRRTRRRLRAAAVEQLSWLDVA